MAQSQVNTELDGLFAAAYPGEAELTIMTSQVLRSAAMQQELLKKGYTKVGVNMYTHTNCPALVLTPAVADWYSMYGYAIIQDVADGNGYIARAGNGMRSSSGPTFVVYNECGVDEVGCSEPYPPAYDPDTMKYREYYDNYVARGPSATEYTVPVKRSMTGSIRVWQLLCTADSFIAHRGVFDAGISVYAVGHTSFPSSATASIQLPTAVGKMLRTSAFRQAALQQYDGKLSAIADAAYDTVLQSYPESLLTVDTVHLVVDCATGSVHGQSVECMTSFPGTAAFGLTTTSFEKTPGSVTPGGTRVTKPASAPCNMRIGGIDNVSSFSVAISPNPLLWFSHSGVCRNALVYDIDQVYTCWDLVSRMFPLSIIATTPETGRAWDMVADYHLAADGDINLYDFDTSALRASTNVATTAITSAAEVAGNAHPVFIDDDGNYTTTDTGKPAGPLSSLGPTVFGAVAGAAVPAHGPHGAVLSAAIEKFHAFIASLKDEVHSEAKKQ